MRYGSDWAIKRAKYNVKYYYDVILVLEQLEASIIVAQKLLPDFFPPEIEVSRIRECKGWNSCWTIKQRLFLFPGISRVGKKKTQAKLSQTIEGSH